MALNNWNTFTTDGTGLPLPCQVFPGNSRRRSLIISCEDGNGIVQFDVKPIIVTNVGLYFTPPGPSFLVLEYSKIGSLICEPWFIYFNGSGSRVTMVEALLG